jgi:hypothetical protein
MFRKLTRISPASCLAMIALFVALGGISYAAGTQIGSSEIKNGAVTKKKLKANSVVTAKIKDNAVTATKIKDDAVTGAKVVESSLGLVPDAAKLAGQDPTAFQSKGFGGGGDAALVNLPSAATTLVASQSLPAGTYLVLARGGFNNNGAEIKTGQSCTLSAGASVQTIGFSSLAANTQPGDREEFESMVVATLPSAGEATLSCKTSAGWESGNVTDPTIAAVSLQP